MSNITSARTRDLPQIFALFEEYDRPNDPQPDLEHSRELLSRIREQGGSVFIESERDGSPIRGTCTTYILHNLARSGRPFAVIENVIISAEHRRSGIGKTLIAHAIEHARSVGCYKVILQTATDHPGNHAFYKACGFSDEKKGFDLRL